MVIALTFSPSGASAVLLIPESSAFSGLTSFSSCDFSEFPVSDSIAREIGSSFGERGDGGGVNGFGGVSESLLMLSELFDICANEKRKNIHRVELTLI